MITEVQGECVDKGEGLGKFHSPVRVLAAFFKKSRDQWKQKCLEAKTELKRFKVRVADVSKSRDTWREKAEARQRELEALQFEVQQLQCNLSDVASQAAAEEKKTTHPPADSFRCQMIDR
jgi:uncharacterized protein YdaU (DUF1376 family)